MIRGTSERFYYLRFMWFGVRSLWPGGGFSLLQAIAAIHNEYLNVPADWRDDPQSDVNECLSYWDGDL